jgi:hypothetical protein
MLFDSAPLPKLLVEITEGKWGEYVDLLMNFFNLSYIDHPSAIFPTGTYFNVELNQKIEIIDDFFLCPDGGRKRLIPKSESEFYLNDLPVIIRYKNDRIIMDGEQVGGRWTTRGTIFQKV